MPFNQVLKPFIFIVILNNVKFKYIVLLSISFLSKLFLIFSFLFFCLILDSVFLMISFYHICWLVIILWYIILEVALEFRVYSYDLLQSTFKWLYTVAHIV